jgi:A/G-specific adenine glycosylase
MLQQTVVKAVVPYFGRWMSQLPDVPSLCRAGEQRVLLLWEGLGYYSRARNIMRAARIMKERHGGEVPDSYKELVALPGIGDYTASAILSIGYGRPFPAVEANVRRLAQRMFLWEVWTREREREIKAVLAGLLPLERPGGLNEALMELGQTVCIPRRPLCSSCPLSNSCRSRRRGVAERIPQRRRHGITSKETRLFLLVTDGKVWLERRNGGLLRGLWFFPGETGDGDGRKTARLPLSKTTNARFLGDLPLRTHHYTRYRERLRPSVFELESIIDSPLGNSLGNRDPGKWVALEELGRVPLPSVYRRIAGDLTNLLGRGEDSASRTASRPGC